MYASAGIAPVSGAQAAARAAAEAGAEAVRLEEWVEVRILGKPRSALEAAAQDIRDVLEGKGFRIPPASAADAAKAAAGAASAAGGTANASGESPAARAASGAAAFAAYGAKIGAVVFRPGGTITPPAPPQPRRRRLRTGS